MPMRWRVMHETPEGWSLALMTSTHGQHLEAERDDDDGYNNKERSKNSLKSIFFYLDVIFFSKILKKLK